MVINLDIDARIPMLFEYYKKVDGGVLVNNIDIDEKFDLAKIEDKIKYKSGLKNYFTLLDDDLNKVVDCYNLVDKYIHGRLYRYVQTTNYSILLDRDNIMITDELTLYVSLFDSGGYVGIPFNKIKGYDTNEYRIFGYINKNGEKIKTYSYILTKDFKYIGKYSMEDVIAFVMLDNTDYVEGYIVESQGEGIINSSILHRNGTTTGLIYEGELELLRKVKRVGTMNRNVITKSELKEFIQQRTIRFKMGDGNATHAMMY